MSKDESRPPRAPKVFTEEEWAEIQKIAATVPTIEYERALEERRLVSGRGQDGSPVELRFDQLSYNEQKLLRYVASYPRKTVQRQLLWKAFPAKSKQEVS